MDRMTTIESNIFVTLLASNITWAILGESPDPPYHLPPQIPIGGALWGARGGLSEGGDIISPTPKCDMFLESP